MNRNIIFGGAIVVAVIVAALSSTGSSEERRGIKISYSSEEGGSYSDSNLNFKGEDVRCKDGETITLTHDDGSETEVTCK